MSTLRCLLLVIAGTSAVGLGFGALGSLFRAPAPSALTYTDPAPRRRARTVSGPETQPAPTRIPLDRGLATIDAGYPVDEDDITVARFRSLLKQLDETYAEEPQAMAEMTVVIQKALRADGIDEDLLPMMEGMNRLFLADVRGEPYEKYLAAYASRRKRGDSHPQALETIRQLLPMLRTSD